jgi:hypothetical protein
MLLSEYEFDVTGTAGHASLLEHFARSVPQHLGDDFAPLRFVVTRNLVGSCRCEVAGVSGLSGSSYAAPAPLFQLIRRGIERTDRFNAVLLVPTGMGAEVGGHAGDAGPLAKLLGEVCDTLILHPNVVNGSDINEMPANALYVEGSVITRLLLGTVGLQRVRSNRVLIVIDDHADNYFVSAAVNSVSGARAAYGLDCPEVVCLSPPIKLRARFASSGRAAGRVEDVAGLCEVLDELLTRGWRPRPFR